MRLLTLTPEFVPGVLELWTQRWGNRFPLDLALWHQNTDGDAAHFHPKRCWVIEDGSGIVGCLLLRVPSRPPAWPGQDPENAWVSFLVVAPGRESDVAPLLLDAALSWLRGAGLKTVSYGGDPFHFFPGVPEEDLALSAVLRGAGFRAGRVVYDLIGDLQSYRAPPGGEHTLRRENASIRACTAGDLPRLFTFLDREFPGRWAYETRRRLEVEPTPADVMILERAADVVGFCHLYHRGSMCIGPSIYWRETIGEGYGGLGPIGVAATLRGRGLGVALTAFALEHLCGFGVRRAVIDWTTLTDFYGCFGFGVWRTYHAWRREL